MKLLVAWFLLGLAFSFNVAAETAFTIKETAVKGEPFSDSATLTTLPANSSVEILKRQGGWTQIKAAKLASGWVRMLNLRLGTASATKQGDSGIGALFNVARSGSSGNTVTTGIRGLSEEDLHSARANPKELKRMQQFSASPSEAQKFANSARLQKQSLAYLREDTNNSASGRKPASSWEDTP